MKAQHLNKRLPNSMSDFESTCRQFAPAVRVSPATMRWSAAVPLETATPRQYRSALLARGLYLQSRSAQPDWRRAVARVVRADR